MYDLKKPRKIRDTRLYNHRIIESCLFVYFKILSCGSVGRKNAGKLPPAPWSLVYTNLCRWQRVWY